MVPISGSFELIWAFVCVFVIFEVCHLFVSVIQLRLMDWSRMEVLYLGRTWGFVWHGCKFSVLDSVLLFWSCRRIHASHNITKDDVVQLYHVNKTLCQGCRANSKDNPNCFCCLVPPPNGVRKQGLWQKVADTVTELGPDPGEALRVSQDSPSGLTNLGATCYVNSVLQCLYMTRYEWILRLDFVSWWCSWCCGFRHPCAMSANMIVLWTEHLEQAFLQQRWSWWDRIQCFTSLACCLLSSIPGRRLPWTPLHLQALWNLTMPSSRMARSSWSCCSRCLRGCLGCPRIFGLGMLYRMFFEELIHMWSGEHLILSCPSRRYWLENKSILLF